MNQAAPDPWRGLDPANNRIPDEARRIHLVAACGTAMGALAAMLQELGFEVTGSDDKVYPPMSAFLASRGIRVMEGFKAENLAHRPDLVVVGNAVAAHNPEALALARLGLPFCSMPQAVNRFAGAGKRIVMVVGTHGKTTTAALLAGVLAAAGRDPSFVVGGILKDFDSNYRLGRGGELVIEGDEYDTAFFDKGPKFLHYRPAVTLLTSIEFDHADIYRDLEHVKSAFRRLVEGLDPQSLLVAGDGDAAIGEVIAACPAGIERYGLREGSRWRLGAVERAAAGTRFEVLRDGGFWGRFRTPMIGRHNLLNALGALAALDRLGVDAAAAACGLASFSGVKRRQEVRGEKRGILVIDDFAHHPTAVAATVEAVRSAYPGRRLLAVFEPRTNTSMRRVFQPVYPAAFDGADLVLIRKPPLLEKVPEAERFSSEALVAELVRRGRDARFFADTEGIIDFIVANGRAGDVVLVMSNGGFDHIHERLLESL
jgi:UDP-N-acetylmuramate: L-alanyl-gamma-D-glutamyl-meso-diaminopimelate ligase